MLSIQLFVPSLLRSVGCLSITLFVASVVSFWPFLRKLLLPSTLKELPGPPRASFLKGNLGQLFDLQGWDFHRDIVKRYGGAVKIHGLCGDEQVYVSDPKALHHIITKDQDVYEETEFFTKSNLVCFGPGLVAVKGQQHQKQRKMMQSVFSANYIRGLTPIFYRVTHELVDVLKHQFDSHFSGTVLEIDMLHWMRRAALEYIGRGGLGYSFGPLDAMSSNVYGDSVRNFAPTLFGLSILRQFLPFFSTLGPAWLRRTAVRMLPIPLVQRLRAIVDIMDRTTRIIFEDKLKRLHAGDESVKAQVSEGKDVMSILLRENIKSEKEDRLTDEELLGQMSTLIFAAEDTTSAALSKILELLARHPSSQERLRDELIEARTREGGDLAYDALHALPYLDAVCRETLRLHPPVYMLHRTTNRDVVLPLSMPVLSVNGTSAISAIHLRRNTNVIIAIEAANRRTDIWGADAEVWRPERWLDGTGARVGDGWSPPKDPDFENRDAEKVRMPGLYSGMMTFLGGGRSCIGFKFAQLEMKTVLAVLLPTFHFGLPAGKRLAWSLGGIVSPGVAGDPEPKLPLRLTLVDGMVTPPLACEAE
ncbi:hypothetical protein M0805_004508 [Coniferiporia weirii]|nr:hypothetical protein M0805_004508 [Coniferiporia weirii]